MKVWILGGAIILGLLLALGLSVKFLVDARADAEILSDANKSLVDEIIRVTAEQKAINETLEEQVKLERLLREEVDVLKDRIDEERTDETCADFLDRKHPGCVDDLMQPFDEDPDPPADAHSALVDRGGRDWPIRW